MAGLRCWLGTLAYLCTCISWVVTVPLPTTTQPKRKDPLEYFLYEELHNGTLIANVAIDAWLPKKYNASTMSQLSYSFQNNDPKLHLFAIDTKTSIVRTTEQIDRDIMCKNVEACVVWMHVAVHPEEYAEIIKIRVEILDKNDHKPVFPHREMLIPVSESAPVRDTQWLLPLATDEDSPPMGVHSYELVTDSRKFELIEDDSRNGSTVLKLELTEPLDRETEEFIQLQIIAYDAGTPPKSGNMLINVTVEDANDNNPTFDNVTYEFFVMENVPPGTVIGVVHAEDKDLGPNGQISYNLSEVAQRDYGHLFGVGESSGLLVQKEALDFEKDSTYLLVVIAEDNGPDSKPGHATVIIRVVDANDNSPEILIESEVAEVRETEGPGAFVGHFSVSDQDGGDNGKVECQLHHDKFTLQSVYQSQYRIVTKTRLNYEDSAEYEVTVVCTDLGKKPNIVMQNIIVRVLDENDNPPSFVQQVYTSHIGENNNIGDVIIQVEATDTDEGSFGELQYMLGPDANGDFEIDKYTGVITANRVFDYEFLQEEMFTVIAYDLGAPPMSATATVIVSILDLNDETPQFTQDKYEFGIFENQPVNTEVGAIGLDLHEMGDIDLTGFFKYSFANPKSKDSMTFLIDERNGHISTKAELDREEKPVYYLTVIATNEGFPPMTGSVSVTVYVADKNDFRPSISYPTLTNRSVSLSSQAPVGYHVTQIEAFDKDIGDNAKLSYAITQGNEAGSFEINQASGVITVAKDLTQISTAQYDLNVIVKDNGFPQQAALARLNIIVNQSIVFVPEQPTKSGVPQAHATVVISVTAACLVLVFLVLFSIMMYLVWKRFSPSLKTNTNKAEKYCYSNMEDRYLQTGGGLPPEDQANIDRGVAEGEEAENIDTNANMTVPQHPVPPTSPSPYNAPAPLNGGRCLPQIKPTNCATFTMDSECLQKDSVQSKINTMYPTVDKNIPKNTLRQLEQCPEYRHSTPLAQDCVAETYQNGFCPQSGHTSPTPSTSSCTTNRYYYYKYGSNINQFRYVNNTLV